MISNDTVFLVLWVIFVEQTLGAVDALFGAGGMTTLGDKFDLSLCDKFIGIMVANLTGMESIIYQIMLNVNVRRSQVAR